MPERSDGMKNITYVSVDVEADGPVPGIYSMLSIGAAAFTLGNKTPIATFEANLRPLPGATTHPETMAWWKTQPDAWEYVCKDQQDPEVVMRKFRAWFDNLPGHRVVVGFPLTFDFAFINWYLTKFTGYPTPLGFSGLDIKTLAAAKLNIPFQEATKKNMPKRWFKGCPRHTHKALDDAIGQGILLLNILSGTSEMTP